MSTQYKACQAVQVSFSVRDPQTRLKAKLQVGVASVCSESQPSEAEARAQLFADLNGHYGPHFSHHRRFVPFGDVMIYKEQSVWSRFFGL